LPVVNVSIWAASRRTKTAVTERRDLATELLKRSGYSLVDDPKLHEQPVQRHHSDAGADSARNTASSHIAGVFALIWAIVAWVEWFLIPIIYPANGGPVPHLAFAPQAILLLLGCVTIALTLPALAFRTRQWRVVLYAVPAAAYLAFLAWGAI
jgi:hypothetical protein